MTRSNQMTQTGSQTGQQTNLQTSTTQGSSLLYPIGGVNPSSDAGIQTDNQYSAGGHDTMDNLNNPGQMRRTNQFQNPHYRSTDDQRGNRFTTGSSSGFASPSTSGYIGRGSNSFINPHLIGAGSSAFQGYQSQTDHRRRLTPTFINPANLHNTGSGQYSGYISPSQAGGSLINNRNYGGPGRQNSPLAGQYIFQMDTSIHNRLSNQYQVRGQDTDDVSQGYQSTPPITVNSERPGTGGFSVEASTVEGAERLINRNINELVTHAVQVSNYAILYPDRSRSIIEWDLIHEVVRLIYNPITGKSAFETSVQERLERVDKIIGKILEIQQNLIKVQNNIGRDMALVAKEFLSSQIPIMKTAAGNIRDNVLWLQRNAAQSEGNQEQNVLNGITPETVDAFSKNVSSHVWLAENCEKGFEWVKNRFKPFIQKLPKEKQPEFNNILAEVQKNHQETGKSIKENPERVIAHLQLLGRMLKQNINLLNYNGYDDTAKANIATYLSKLTSMIILAYGSAMKRVTFQLQYVISQTSLPANAFETQNRNIQSGLEILRVAATLPFDDQIKAMKEISSLLGKIDLKILNASDYKYVQIDYSTLKNSLLYFLKLEEKPQLYLPYIQAAREEIRKSNSEEVRSSIYQGPPSVIPHSVFNKNNDGAAEDDFDNKSQIGFKEEPEVVVIPDSPDEMEHIQTNAQGRSETSRSDISSIKIKTKVPSKKGGDFTSKIDEASDEEEQERDRSKKRTSVDRDVEMGSDKEEEFLSLKDEDSDDEQKKIDLQNKERAKPYNDVISEIQTKAEEMKDMFSDARAKSRNKDEETDSKEAKKPQKKGANLKVYPALGSVTVEKSLFKISESAKRAILYTDTFDKKAEELATILVELTSTHITISSKGLDQKEGFFKAASQDFITSYEDLKCKTVYTLLKASLASFKTEVIKSKMYDGDYKKVILLIEDKILAVEESGENGKYVFQSSDLMEMYDAVKPLAETAAKNKLHKLISKEIYEEALAFTYRLGLLKGANTHPKGLYHTFDQLKHIIEREAAKDIAREDGQQQRTEALKDMAERVVERVTGSRDDIKLRDKLLLAAQKGIVYNRKTDLEKYLQRLARNLYNNKEKTGDKRGSAIGEELSKQDIDSILKKYGEVIPETTDDKPTTSGLTSEESNALRKRKYYTRQKKKKALEDANAASVSGSIASGSSISFTTKGALQTQNLLGEIFRTVSNYADKETEDNSNRRRLRREANLNSNENPPADKTIQESRDQLKAVIKYLDGDFSEQLKVRFLFESNPRFKITQLIEKAMESIKKSIEEPRSLLRVDHLRNAIVLMTNINNLNVLLNAEEKDDEMPVEFKFDGVFNELLSSIIVSLRKDLFAVSQSYKGDDTKIKIVFKAANAALLSLDVNKGDINESVNKLYQVYQSLEQLNEYAISSGQKSNLFKEIQALTNQFKQLHEVVSNVRIQKEKYKSHIERYGNLEELIKKSGTENINHRWGSTEATGNRLNEDEDNLPRNLETRFYRYHNTPSLGDPQNIETRSGVLLFEGFTNFASLVIQGLGKLNEYRKVAEESGNANPDKMSPWEKMLCVMGGVPGGAFGADSCMISSWDAPHIVNQIQPSTSYTEAKSVTSTTTTSTTSHAPIKLPYGRLFP
jgi:hypothetical protein